MPAKAKPKPKPAPAARSQPAPKPAASPSKPAPSGFRLNPPKTSTFWASIVVSGVGLLLFILKTAGPPFDFPFANGISFLLVLAGFVLLVVGLLVKGF